MPYDVDVQINLTVKGFPPLKSTIKPKNITDSNSKILSFKNSSETCLMNFVRPTAKDPSHVEKRRMYCQRFALGSPSCDVAFVAIKAKSYKYKACPVGDTSGIGFALTDTPLTIDPSGNSMLQGHDGDGCVNATDIVWIDSDYIAIDFCAKTCANKGDSKQTWIAVFVDPALFECNPNPDATFEVMVAYGLAGDRAADAPPASCCTPVAVRTSQGPRQFQMA